MAFYYSNFSINDNSSVLALQDNPHAVPPSTIRLHHDRTFSQEASTDQPPEDLLDLTRRPTSSLASDAPQASSNNPPAHCFFFYTIRGFPPLAGNDYKKNLDYIYKISPVDWCDSFTLCSHFNLKQSPKKFPFLSSSFLDLNSHKDLHSWLATKCNAFPIALLGSSRSRRPMILHNLLINPDSSLFSNPPKLELLALDQRSFDSTPLSIKPEDWDNLLLAPSFQNIPTTKEIISFCVSPILGVDSTSWYGFFLDKEKFNSFLPNSAPFDSPDNHFCCGSLLLVLPSISGQLLHLLDPTGQDPCSKTSSFGSLCSALYLWASLHWWIDDSRSHDEKSQQIPLSNRLMSCLDPIFRFIWIMKFKHPIPQATIPSCCKSLPQAINQLLDHCIKIFPSLCTSSNLCPPPQIPITTSTFPSTPTVPRPSCHLQNSPNQSPSGPHSGKVEITDNKGQKIWVSPEIYLMSQTVQALNKHSSPNNIDNPDSKSLFAGLAPHFKNQIKFTQVEATNIVLPQSLPPVVIRIFKQRNTTTFFETLLIEVFPPSLNCCIILFGQMAILQCYGICWRSEGMPGGFNPFSFDPHTTPGLENNNALDNEIRQKIHKASIRHLNDIKVCDIQGIYSDNNLHFPQTNHKFEIQLRSFSCLIKGLFGNTCFMAEQVDRILQHFYKYKPCFISISLLEPDGLYYGRVLFAIDQGIQNFIAHLSNPSSINDIDFDELVKHVDHIIFTVKNRLSFGSLPPALASKFQEQQRCHQTQNTPSNKQALDQSSSPHSDSQPTTKIQDTQSKDSQQSKKHLITFSSPNRGIYRKTKNIGKSSQKRPWPRSLASPAMAAPSSFVTYSSPGANAKKANAAPFAMTIQYPTENHRRY